MTMLRAVALAVALAAGMVGVTRGTWAVGGSDSSCYGLMAAAFGRGTVQPATPLALEAPWPDAARTFAPGGFIPSPVHPEAASPVCAPGFSLFLAPLYRLGGADAIFLLTPLAGALLVYVTFVLGRRLAGEVAGLAAAIVVATSPIFVFQVVQPMNDVFVALLLVMAVTLAIDDQDRTAALGVLTGMAVLVRPNLAPAALVITAWCAVDRRKRLAAFLAAAAPFVVVLLMLNSLLYGRALGSGYGDVDRLFAANHLASNLVNYGRALLTTQLGFPLLGVAALFVVSRQRRRDAALLLVVCAAVIGVYLFYRPFPEWWYLRFFLPVLPLLTVLAAAVLTYAFRRPVVILLAMVAVSVHAMTSPAMREALDLGRQEHRFRVAGTLARDRLPANTAVLTVWESGSIRYFADREVVVWDSLDPTQLDEAIAWLTMRGYETYIMVEEWEEPLFRQRFGPHLDIGQLDWPPRFDIERRVKVFSPSDRARYLAGEPVTTELVRANRR